MAGDILSSILSYAGWAFLPKYITSFIQSFFYRITIRAGSPHPHPSTPRYARHYRRIYVSVVTCYLLYTIFETFHQVCRTGDFYSSLGVSPTADERTIKSRFRRLAALHHPDKIQQFPNDGDSDAFFVHLRLAQDTLLDPTKRFAYDRFGAGVVNGSRAKSMREFLYAGLYALFPQYAVGFVIMTLLNLFWFSSWGRYWRFYTFFALFTLEVSLLTHPNGTFIPAHHLPAWLTGLLHIDSFYLLPFQILTLARRASVALNIFISQLVPSGQSSGSSAATMPSLHPETHRQFAQLVHLSRAIDIEATRLLQLGLAPFKGDKAMVGTLRRGMKEGLILGSVRDSPEVKEALRLVLERRRAA